MSLHWAGYLKWCLRAIDKTTQTEVNIEVWRIVKMQWRENLCRDRFSTSL